jgi:exopolysaccharide biosynthesis polyprenyl glycosylphosphotransferase
MTPPAASTQIAANSQILIPRQARGAVAQQIGKRLLGTREWVQLRLLVDGVVLFLASSAALFADPRVASVTSNRWLAVGFPLIVLGMMHARRVPDDRFNVSLLDTLANVLGIVSLAAMLTISADAIFGGAAPLALASRLWLFAVVYLGMARAVLVSVRRQAMRSEAFATPTLIVGAGVIGGHLVRRLFGEPRYGLRPVGFLDSDPMPIRATASLPSVPVLGGSERLADAIAETGARHVILAFSHERDHVLVAKVRECQALGVRVSLVPRLYESINERTTLDHVGGLPLLTLHSIDPKGWQFAIKHGVDRGLALVSLCVLSPLLLGLALGVRLSSPGPIFFRQRRVGRDGREFTMLKFRTMRGDPSAEGEADAGWAQSIRSDLEELAPAEPEQFDVAPDSAPAAMDRTTTIGRFLRDYSLDELPQLLNVLRGDMSLVGPRPERVSYVRDFEQLVDRYADRHRVKSGLTGWAQVNGLRGETSIADRVEWDNYYIQNWSLWLDLRIVALTVTAIFKPSASK